MSNILIILGHWQTVGQQTGLKLLGNKLSTLGHSLRLKECLESGTPENKVTFDDILWSDVDIAFSHGMASRKRLEHDAGNPVMEGPLEICIAGVWDAFYGQAPFILWHPNPGAKKAVCFQVDDIPTSQPYHGVDLWDSIEHAQLDESPLWVPENRIININCNGPFGAGWVAPFSKHTGIIKLDGVHDAILRLVGAAAEAA